MSLTFLFANRIKVLLLIVALSLPTLSLATPVILDSLHEHRQFSGSRSWRAPNYSDQEGVLGWHKNAFAVPEGLQRQVDFWIDIYTKYTTQQGVIHDAELIDLVYEVVDFTTINIDANSSSNEKQKKRRALVDEAKQRAITALEKIEGVTDSSTLTEYEKKIWFYFRTKETVSKIPEAKNLNRIRFQLGQSDRMETAIFLSGRYLEKFEEIFADKKLPKELTRLVFVESSFNVLARSKVGASGLWQIMPGTARPFRLISSSVDGRNNPWLATEAATQILRDNYRKLESWPLAVTGYNHGPAGVARVVERYESRDLVHLIQNVRSRASFGFASRNFYASFLAALHVEQNASKYFPNIEWSQPLDHVEIKLTRNIGYRELLDWFSHDSKKLQIFNPHITTQAKSGIYIPQNTVIYVPTLKESVIQLAMSRRDNKQGRNVSGGIVTKHQVRRGENLSRIANKYGVALNDIISENQLDPNFRIIPGQTLKIPK